jgi:hypothetical protein
LACSKIIKLNQFNTLHMMQCEICFLVFWLSGYVLHLTSAQSFCVM